MDSVTLSRLAWPVPWGTLQLALLGLIGLVVLLLLLVIIAALALRARRGGTARQRAVPAPPAAACAWLSLSGGPGAGARYVMGYPTTTLGSSPQAQVSIPHPQVAPQHATISWEGSGLVLRDLGSPSGTFVNGHRVSGAVWVRPGDVISLGGAVQVVIQLPGGGQ